MKELVKRELMRRPIYECRCDGRLKTKAEGSKRLAYTGLLGGLEHPKDRYEVNTDVHGTILYETLQVVGLAEAARTTIRLQKKTMNLCACDSEERERGVGAGVNATMLFETLQVVGLAEAARTAIRLRHLSRRDTPLGLEVGSSAASMRQDIHTHSKI
jgi:hypothetical protein